MAESKSHRTWTVENTVHFSVRLQKKGDADILAYFDKQKLAGISRLSIIKLALREYMERHREEQT